MESSAEVVTPRGSNCDTCRARKVKCDREKPTCARCRRGCLSCAYSLNEAGSAWRKSYHEDAETRLTHERELRKTTAASDPPHLAGIDTLIARFSKPIHTLKFSDGLSTSSSVLLESVDRVSNGLVIHFQDGSSNFYSTISIVGQIFETEQCLQLEHGVGAPTVSKSPGLFLLETLRNSLCQSSLQDVFRLPVIHQYPSQQTIERAVTSFFLHHDVHYWPLFAEDSFRNNTRQYYHTPDARKCPATAVGLWYVASQSLRQELVECHTQNPAYSGIKQTLEESVKALHVACMNYVSAPEYIKPCITDVQALTIAAITALHEGRNREFRRALEAACALAKEVGLHQKSRQTSALGSLEENLWVFWGLYVLDKISLVSGGNSCLLPSSDCAVSFPSKPRTISPEGHHLRMARIQLAGIQEQIYTDLYTAGASRRSMQQRQRSISSAATDLRQWASSYLPPAKQANQVKNPPMLSALHTGASFLYMHALCLVWKASMDFEDSHKLSQAAWSGNSLIFKALSTSNFHPVSYEAREIFSLVTACAALPVLTIFRFIVYNAGSGFLEDACMLRKVVRSIVSYAEHAGGALKSSDMVETARALDRELEYRLSSADRASTLLPANSTEAPWVSSTLAHIMEVDPLSSPVDTSLSRESVPLLTRSSTRLSSGRPSSHGTGPPSNNSPENVSLPQLMPSSEAYLSSMASMTTLEMESVPQSIYAGMEGALESEAGMAARTSIDHGTLDDFAIENDYFRV